MAEIEGILNKAIQKKLNVQAKREAVRELRKLKLRHSANAEFEDIELLDSQIRLLELSL